MHCSTGNAAPLWNHDVYLLMYYYVGTHLYVEFADYLACYTYAYI